MMSRRSFAVIVFAVLLWSGWWFADAEAFSPRLEQAEQKEVAGTYSLVLFDSGLGNGIQRIAVLDREGDSYRFEPYAPEFEYKIVRGLSGSEALQRAQHYLAVTPEYWKSQLSRIKGPAGEVLGYELRPLYQRTVFGMDDVLEISYRVKGETVFIHMRLKDPIDRLFRSSGGARD